MLPPTDTDNVQTGHGASPGVRSEVVRNQDEGPGTNGDVPEGGLVDNTTGHQTTQGEGEELAIGVAQSVMNSNLRIGGSTAQSSSDMADTFNEASIEIYSNIVHILHIVQFSPFVHDIHIAVMRSRAER